MSTMPAIRAWDWPTPTDPAPVGMMVCALPLLTRPPAGIGTERA